MTSGGGAALRHRMFTSPRRGRSVVSADGFVSVRLVEEEARMLSRANGPDDDDDFL